MIKLLRKSAFTEEQNSARAAVYTKYYQHLEITRFLSGYTGEMEGFVCEIGPWQNFKYLRAFQRARLCIIDPYNNATGGGLANVPQNLPYPCSLYRCLLGVDSRVIPDRLLDLSFSVSVLEHIGQAECGYDCNPVEQPPEVQEAPRNAFCRELFRITKPGGITVHTVDHAARNLTLVKNFLATGFEPMNAGSGPTLDECLSDPDVIRQQRDWIEDDKPMPEEERVLHGVLFMAFRRPQRLFGRLWKPKQWRISPSPGV